MHSDNKSLQVQLNQKALLMQVLCYHYHSTMYTSKSSAVRFSPWWKASCIATTHTPSHTATKGNGVSMQLMSNESCMLIPSLKVQFSSLVWSFLPDAGGWDMFFRCLRAGMGIHLVFTWKSHFQFKTPFNIKIFYKFFNNRQRWNYGSVSTKVASASNSRTSGTFFNRKCTAGKLANNSISNQIALLNIFKSQFPGAFPHIFAFELNSSNKNVNACHQSNCNWWEIKMRLKIHFSYSIYGG